MGYFVKETEMESNILEVVDLNNILYALIEEDREYAFSTTHAGLVTRELYNTISEYGSTQVEKRKDKPKLYRYEPFKGLYDTSDLYASRLVLMTHVEADTTVITFKNMDMITLEYMHVTTEFTEYELKSLLGKNFNPESMVLVE